MRKKLYILSLVAGALALSACSKDTKDADRAAMDSAAADADVNSDAANEQMVSPVDDSTKSAKTPTDAKLNGDKKRPRAL